MSTEINSTKFLPIRPRLDYVDNLRVFACFLVLLTHSTMPGIDSAPIWYQLISFTGSPSSELFLALSGTVLLPVSSNFRVFYRKRFIKLYPPLIIWSILGVLLYTQTQGIGMEYAWARIIRIPFQPAIPVYWFVYTMVGLYLLAPFISPWIKTATRKQVEIFLSIWIVNMTFPWVLYFFPNLTHAFNVNGNYYWEFCYFGGFLGYWVLGYYLNKYPIKIGLNAKWTILLMGVCLYPAILYYLKCQNCDVSVLMDNLQLGSAVLVAFIYTVIQNIKLPVKVQLMVSKIARYSFCIYLTHIYIARELYWGMFDGSMLHIVPRTFLIALLTMLTGYLLAYIISHVPKGKYIIGA